MITLVYVCKFWHKIFKYQIVSMFGKVYCSSCVWIVIEIKMRLKNIVNRIERIIFKSKITNVVYTKFILVIIFIFYQSSNQII